MKTKIFIMTVIILLSYNVKSQTKELTDTNIIYHDFIPDTLLDSNNDTLSIDFNEDGIFDIKFHFDFVSLSRVSYIKTFNNTYFTIFPSDLSDSLTSSLLYWKNGDKYWGTNARVGIKLIIDSEVYYGWISAIRTSNVNEVDWDIIVDKYAFCKIPDYPFLYGQTALITGAEKSLKIEKTNVFVADSGSSVVVNSDKKIANISITNIAGETLAKQNKVNANNKTIKTQNFAKGTYIVKVQFADGDVFTKKVVL